MKEDTITVLKELANKYNIRSGTDKSIIHNQNEQSENNENNEKSEAEELDDFLREHYCPDKGNKRYDRVRKEIINSKTLTATQIEAVNQAIDAGILEDEVLTMIRMNKEANVMMKYVELVGKVEKKYLKLSDKIIHK